MAKDSHPVLPSTPTIADVQQYIKATVAHRGFSHESVQDNFIMLTEELGELAKALRKLNGVKVATDSTMTSVEEEVADVAWMLMCVCNKLGIDLESAIRAKEEKNKQRVWK